MGNHSFYTAYSSVLDPFRVFFHELGHMLDHFLKYNMHISISNKLKDFLTSKIINFNNWAILDKEKFLNYFILIHILFLVYMKLLVKDLYIDF
ncbi:hypothetical protein [Spiroplasma phoeniceum]|uniref:hypothetical protein n=1 Tax=Spiroplasma phoeniceum TaxID=47835 RepID=UPI001FE52454|nr:hypothetical protein [Spiroplasma phoeniceum]